MSTPTPNYRVHRTDAQGLSEFTDDALLVLELTRREVEIGNIASALERLLVMTDTREAAMRFRENLLINVTGYEHDLRELVEIPEVRSFFTQLTLRWPHWMWFLCRNAGAIPMLMGFLCKVQVHRRGDRVAMEFIDRQELGVKMLDLFERGNAMFTAFGITAEESRISAESACLELTSQ